MTLRTYPYGTPVVLYPGLANGKSIEVYYFLVAS